MKFKSAALDPASERRVAVDLFNYVWSLLEKQDRTEAEDDAMLHAAHASRFHWAQVGGAENCARGDWQVSRVYAALGRSEPALHHAQRCLQICLSEGLRDFDLAFAYEALARSMAVAGNVAERDRYVQLALTAGTEIAEEDDRKIFDADIATVIDVKPS